MPMGRTDDRSTQRAQCLEPMIRASKNVLISFKIQEKHEHHKNEYIIMNPA